MTRILGVWFLAALSIDLGCGVAPETNAERLIGTWEYVNADQSTVFQLKFMATAYVSQQITLTTTASGDDEIETGSYVATETGITATPAAWSCPGPDPIGIIGYSFTAAGSLEITPPGGVTILSRDTAPASTNTALTYGCIQSDGSFVAAPLAPVTNQ
jgi:hypothetical protein